MYAFVRTVNITSTRCRATAGIEYHAVTLENRNFTSDRGFAMRQKLINVQIPFFIPVWRRISVIALCLAWALLEVSADNIEWAVLATGIAVYCAHQFFLAFDPKEK